MITTLIHKAKWGSAALVAITLITACGKAPVKARAKAITGMTALEEQAFDASNELRLNPQSFLPDLQKIRANMKGDFLILPGERPIRTREGVAAVDEAINYLKSAKPVGPLAFSPLLMKAARDHQLDQAETGEIGHYGQDRSSPRKRIERYAVWNGTIGENISYGEYGGSAGRWVVLALFIDDGVPDRGHRHNLMQSKFKEVGVACGAHKGYRTMCVLDYATKTLPRPASSPAP